ncbi:MAG: hypothetical protein IKR04_08225 [Clostridia bacterium]|nr:hypothetical protein [Clostridia bacterium]
MNLKRFLIIAVVVIAIIFVAIRCSERHPMSGDTFTKIMEKNDYRVIDNLHVKETDMLYESRIEDLKTDHDPMESYSSTNVSMRTEFVYKIFPTEEDAVRLVTKYDNAKKLDVTRDQRVGDYGVTSSGKDAINRNGDNYQIRYYKEFDDRYFLVSRIGNTILLASIHSDDVSEVKKMLREYGYMAEV